MTDDVSLEQRALAALETAFDQTSETRIAWLESTYADDPALIARVKELLEDEDDGLPALRTGGARDHLDDDIQLERAGAYRITGLIGRGGMGAVYTAERETGDFDHNVAVKVIRPGVLSDALIGRFENERQILANLNHPNIARLFDGGTLSDGSPYMIMEHVDGAPITEWVQTKALSKTERLNLFRTVCAAVEYAHQNLIVHRDITPTNVMVSQAGEVKLIDFGIAKPQAENVAETEAVSGSLASLTFTPGFAAPERAQGAPTNTLSDVYSLGKLLEAMIEGSQRSSEITKIVERATETKPSHRYPSVAALSADVHNYLTNHPIDAVNGGASYRFSKFLKRRRLAAAFGCVAAISLASAFAVTWTQYQRAETALVSANERFDQAREMANFMLFDLFENLQDIPGNSEALQLMADRAQLYLDDLSQSSRANAGLELETIQGYHRLANIEGNPIGTNLGRRENARALLNIAEQRLLTLHNEKPDDPEVLAELGSLYFSRSVFAYIADDDNAASIDFAERSVGYFDTLISKGIATLDQKIERFDAVLYTAKPLIWMEQTASAVAKYEAIEDAILRFGDENSSNEKVQYSIATFYISFTEVANWDVYLTGSAPDTMLRVSDIAVARIDTLNAIENPERDYRRSRAIAYYRRGTLLGEIGRFDRSVEDLTIATNIMRELYGEDAANESNRSLLNAVESQLMHDLSASGEHVRALAIGEPFLDRVTAAHRAEPENPGYWRDYFAKLQMIGEVYIDAERLEEACDYLLKSIQSARQFDEEIGLSAGDKDQIFDDLLGQEQACQNGSIAEFRSKR